MSDLLIPVGNLSSEAGKASSKTGRKAAQKARAYPLSYAQQRLWFVEQLEPATAAYNIPCALKLAGSLDRAALQRSLNEIVRRHETLRTSVIVHQDKPVQKIAPELELAVEERDLRDVPAGQRYNEARRLIEAIARVPFDLSHAPLMRVVLLQLGENDHILLVVMHHIVSDGWSIGVMVREFCQLYEAYVNGKESPLDELKIQYLDYAIWQHNWLKGQILEEQLVYWRKQLADVPALELPADYSRAHVQEQAGTVDWQLPEKLSSDLNELSQREGVTLFMTLLAALQILLSRYSGQNDIAIGTPIAGRRSTETEALIGFFINTLVLRTHVDSDVSFIELLQRVRTTTLDAYAHQDVPFEKLVEELHPKRDPGRTPFFQTMFVFQNAPQSAIELPGLALSEIEIGLGATKFDVKITATKTKGMIRGNMEYRADLFRESSMRTLLEHWERLLAEIVLYPHKKVRDLSIITESDEQRILAAWNDPALESPQPNVFDVFDEQAVRTPNAVAIEYGAERLTYQELRRQTDAVEASLLTAGAKFGDLVLIFSAERSRLIAAMIGVLKAGCGFVPMLPSLPNQRIAAMLAQCQPAWAIVEAGLASRFGKLKHDSGQPIQEIEIASDALIAESRRRQDRSGDELSYIFFTSGSTGTPKAIAGRLKGINHFIDWEIKEFGINRESRVAQLTSPMFDPLLRDVFVPLCSGGTLCIPSDPDLVLNGAELGQWLEQERITLMHTVPSIFRLMMSQCGSLRFPALKHVLLAGETVLPADVSNWHALAGSQGARLINLYGPSETTMVKFLYAMEEEDQSRRSIPIGRPMDGARAIVIDEAGRVCPTGIAGEIYIRTPYRALGYHKQPELTAQVFVPNPFSNDPQDVVYKTGDLARQMDDGSFILMGRRDHQVKIHGVRIELGEIEAALSECEGVSAAVVVAREDQAGEKRLVGYAVAQDGASINSKDLRAALKNRLPESMVPAAFVVLKEMPLTSNGKVDRKALPEPDSSQSGQQYVAPRTAEEEILCGIWAEVLKLPRVGIENNFFEIGGHSLLATQLIARVRSAFNLEIPVRAIFESPSVERLAERIQLERRKGQKIQALPLRRAPRESSFLPLSYAQQRLWFLDQLAPGSAAYNISMKLRLSGELNHDAMTEALNEIVRRHEVLRTRFAVQDGSPVQEIAEQFHVKVEEKEIAAGTERERAEETRKLVREEVGRAFDLGRGPLLRVKLLRIEEQEHVLVVTMHHIVSDGWSMGIAVREFAQLYAGYVSGETVRLAEMEVQYGDYAVWQREWLQGEVLEEQIGYWKKQLANVATLNLPTDRPRPELMSQRGERIQVRVKAEVLKGLQEVSRREGVTLFMTLLASWQMLLARYSGQRDIAVGVPIAGRTRVETNGLIGCFVNTLVMRSKVRREEKVRELLGQVRERTLEAYEHQEVPFEKLVEELQPERDLSRQPLFQVMFGLQNMWLHGEVGKGGEEAGEERGGLKLPGLELGAMKEDHEEVTGKFDLMLLVQEEGEEGLGGVLEYNVDLFDRASVERMVKRWERVLEQMAEDVERPIGAIELLEEEEKRRMEEGWRGAERKREIGEEKESYVEMVAREGRKNPDRRAVVEDGKELSYGELNREGNRWGRYLRKKGVKAGSRIGAQVGTWRDGIVITLGVLKCGGVVVWLGEDEPEKRLEQMVKTSESELVITSGRGEVWRKLEESGVAVLRLEKVRSEVERESGEELEIEKEEREKGGYIEYVSGATGKPVGVLVKERELGEERFGGDLRIGEGECVAVGEWGRGETGRVEIMRALGWGACVVSVGTRERRGRNKIVPGKMARKLRDEGVTVWLAGAEELEAVAQEFPWALKGIKRVVCEERLEILEQVKEKLGEKIAQRVYGVYGYSEAGGACLLYGLGERKGKTGMGVGAGLVKVEHVGRGMRLYLLNEEMQAVGEGELGEIYIAGEGVAESYVGVTEESAAGFVLDLYAGEAGKGMYRTGDLGWRRGDGTLEFRGREDGRMKVAGGLRVEAREVEAALEEEDGVKEAAVVLRDRTKNEEGREESRREGWSLEAAVVMKEGVELDEEKMLRHLEEKLRKETVPGRIVQVEEIGRTEEGGVDRKRVIKMLEEKERRGKGQEYVGPRNGIEEQVAEIWAKTFGVERVGMNENFFELGGHSLLATQVVARISDGLGVEIELRRMFEKPTVAGVAEAVAEALEQKKNKEADAGEAREKMPALVRVPREQSLPLSFAQQRLWFIDQLEPGSATYNIPAAYLLKGTLDKEALKQSLNEIVKRHEVLRTVFPTQDGQAVQKIAAEMPLVINEVDLSGFPVESRIGKAQAEARKEAETPFDLAQGPLVRVKLLRVSHDEHVLLATMHHIVSDGWSMIVLQREFSLLYQAYATKASSPLKEVTIQYADYAVWQRNWLQGQVLEEQLGYWRKQLAEVAALELPTDKPRPVVLSESGADIILEIGERESSKLRSLARSENSTVFMVLLAVLDTLLWRYSGQNDIAIGTGIANRTRTETEGLIGFFVNTLVLRLNIQGSSSARDLLTQARHTTLDAYRYQDVPFEKLIEDLQPERDLGRTPLFQVALVLQNFSTKQISLPNLELQSFDAVQSAAKTELRFLLDDTGPSLKGTITYAVDLFEPATIVRMAGHWKHLLTEFVTHLDRPLSELSLMGEAERRQILEQWSKNEEHEFSTESIATLFAQQAARTPDALAVIWPEGTITYRNMAKRAWQLGRYLHELGVGPETPVGICLEPGADLIVAFFAVIAAGATYVPLDPDYPAERLGYMLEDAGPAVVITETRLQDRLPDHRAKLVYLDRESEMIAARSAEVLDVDVGPENLLYMIFTSGSTGRPKGVAVSQGAMVSRALFLAEWYKSRIDDRSLQILSPSFDAFGGGLYTTLLTGGAIVFTRPEQMLDPAQLCTAIEQMQVTTLRIPVGYLRELLSYAAQNKCVLPESLRLIITGGETISRTEMRDLLKLTAPQARFIHEYGPTETTITATLHEDDLNTESLANSHRSLIGKPNANTRVYVLGEAMEAAAQGVIGELYIGGASLARCYTGPSWQTAQKFVPDPFSRTGERLYRTGDWGRWLADGTLEFLGRRDDQVKLRGYRIELGEIEAALRQHEAISNVAVIVREDKLRSKRLVAYVVAKEKLVPAAAELRSFLEEKLPDYMVPSVFVEMIELPFMAGGGKLDRKRLPEPAEEEETAQDPRTPTEEILCGIWADILKRERIGTNQNFFAMGGHSLLATQIISRVRQVFNLELPLRVLFEAQTVAGFAERIDQAKQAVNFASAPPVRRTSREGALPLSYAQQRLWFLDQLAPGSAAYNISMKLRLSGELNREAMTEALNEIVRRHEVLRTRFAVKDGSPVQEIAEEFHVRVEEKEIAAGTAEEREEETRKLVRAEVGRAFDLGRGPLLRVKLLQVGEQEHVLVVTMHHIVSDGWSMGIAVREFAQLYAGYVSGEKVQLAEMEVQYGDYAVWQREWLQGEVLEEQIGYWKKQLGNVATLNLPTDRPRPEVMSQRGERIQVRVKAEVLRGLQEVSRREGVTLFMTLLASWQMLLARYSGQRDIAVGVPIAGRTRVETNGLIGCFVNTLVMRSKVRREEKVRELLGQVRERTLEAYEHQEVPFEKLVEELQPERDLSRQPLFQVMFGLQNMWLEGGSGGVEAERFRLPGLELAALKEDHEEVTAKFDLMLLVQEEGEEGLGGVLEYNVDLFDRVSVERMVGRWERVLEQVAEDVDRRIGGMVLLEEEEKRRMEEGWRGEERKREIGEGEKTESYVEQVAGEARRNPDGRAVVEDGEKLSYVGLNEEGNRWGRYLRKKGVSGGIRVGLQVGSWREGIVITLGVLKCGGVVVWLGEDEPEERLKQMVRDSESGIMITSIGSRRETGAGEDGVWRRLEENGVEVLRVEEVKSEVEKESGEELEIEKEERKKGGYIEYVSGSQGRPVGVLVKERELGEERFGGELGIGEGDCVAVGDWGRGGEAGRAEILRALTRGARVVNVGGSGRKKMVPGKMARMLRDEGVTVWWAGSEELEAVAQEFPWALKNLRRVVCEERMELLEEVKEKLGAEIAQRVYGVYGYSEAGGACLMYGLGEKTGAGVVKVEHVGRGVRLYLLNGEMQAVGEGELGEIYIAGEGVAESYVGATEESAARFVLDPYAEESGKKMYRTGDLGWRRGDGTLEFCGRKDGRMKVAGGLRVEAQEVEAALEEEDGVKEAAVVLRNRGRGEESRGESWELEAAVVMKEGVELNEEEMTRHLEGKLRKEMVPRRIVPVEEIARGEEGRVDRGKLLRILEEMEQKNNKQEYVGPRNEIEEQVAEIWAKTFGVERVGMNENFFELGGHSLLATQVVARISDGLGVEIGLRRMFERPTVAGVAEAVAEALEQKRNAEAEGAEAAGEKMPGLVRVSREQSLPLSSSQQRLWFLDQLDSGNRAYNLSAVLRLRGDLRINILAVAIEEIIRRHEVLRTSFPAIDGTPYQSISPTPYSPVELVDLSNLPLQEKEARVRDLVFEQAQRSFDLANGPLLRTTLYKLQENEHVLCFIVHHIIFDGWSIPILLRELTVLYEAFLHGRPSPLPDLPLQYADFAVWERASLQGKALERHLDYWRAQLEACSQRLELPTDFQRPPVQSFRGDTHRIQLSPELSRSLQNLGRGQGATMYMTLLALIDIWLSHYSKQRDILVGTPVANRSQLETEAMIGFFVNTLVFRNQIEPESRFIDLLSQVRTNVLEGQAHQAVPFETLVDALHIERDPSRNPLFQMMFNMEPPSDGKMEIPGVVEMEPMRSGFLQSRFDLYLVAIPRVTGLELVCNYSSDLFRPSTIETMLGSLAELIRLALETPQARISGLMAQMMQFEQRQLVDRQKEKAQRQVAGLRGVQRRAVTGTTN